MDHKSTIIHFLAVRGTDRRGKVFRFEISADEMGRVAQARITEDARKARVLDGKHHDQKASKLGGLAKGEKRRITIQDRIKIDLHEWLLQEWRCEPNNKGNPKSGPISAHVEWHAKGCKSRNIFTMSEHEFLEQLLAIGRSSEHLLVVNSDITD
ncbi:uncharacterized protein B0I36DRAFT_354456 [Microdochium trichocladiopsis]|uniref:Uncharacterized protein n=1 Tax=Microdochium trichocladiopsis TaxID=1682393 RepID=A0A9P9BH61_9PEZI|nr:uncharacterized protein B0I36DRAFT_354456 [Microdochium trichocladiopsis]KAH7018149.1 hypothetical protein B0I36DRAFT_354456 [Microdochium trichocladiopsis]